MMASHQREDIASKLLHSSDARIAEAAKRVFSSSSTMTTTLPYLAPSSSASDGGNVPFEEGSSPMMDDGCCDDLRLTSSGGLNNDGGGGLHGKCNTKIIDGGGEDDADSVISNDGDAQANDRVDGCLKRKPSSSTDRLKRSRERNRMHARKTRQRKKEHMQKLQNRVDELKHEQIRIKQAISEKNTASILLGLFQNGDDGSKDNGGCGGAPIADDPRVEALLRRSSEDIPDASNIPELPALILPGNGKRKFADGGGDANNNGDGRDLLPADEALLEDGIDYMLLGKDRSACTPAELDQIRRERNRMHAKRTRDRKRIFMEEMEVMIKRLEDENSLLLSHANMVNAHVPPSNAAVGDDPGMTSCMQAITPSGRSSTADDGGDDDERLVSKKGDFLNQIESLLAAAGSFQRNGGVVECEINAITCAESDVTASTSRSDHNSLCEEEYEEDDRHSRHELLGSSPSKRQRIAMDVPSSVPKSITTTNYGPVMSS
ncbi:hypothetical protein ACHAXA_003584 [Cyclostephanos tholiformis]|uniref:BZIP domain-containing protein n=1 Tax=Cyclostephanos tholiformis TaxID=382380 RepID=A0ABD3RSV8_9STRA